MNRKEIRRNQSGNSVFRAVMLGMILCFLAVLPLGKNAAADALTSSDVARVQTALNEAGFDCGEPDGVLGVNTINAIFAYQAEEHLEETGSITEELIDSLGLREAILQGESGGSGNEADTYNLLIVGSDRRDDTWNGNSDAIILMSINHDTKTLSLVSFMRDLYAAVPGHGIHKINYSYAVGGIEKLKETLISNFNIKIDNYIAVDWETASLIVDTMGGVDIEVKDYELDATNTSIRSTASNLGYNPEEYVLTYSGYRHLNGVQAVGYARVRYAGNSDFERTERQRRLIHSMLDAVDVSALDQLEKLLTQIMPDIDHDLSPLDFLKLMPQVSGVKTYASQDIQVPYNGLWYSQNEMLVPTQPVTNEQLQRDLY